MSQDDMEVTPAAFREPRLRRGRRQLATTTRALLTGIARGRSLEPVAPINGPALAALLRDAGARDARALELQAGRPPWTNTGLRAQPGEEVTWMVRGRASLGVVRVDAPSTFGLRIGDGPIRSMPAESGAAMAPGGGEVRVTNLFPGEPLEDGSVALDRTPFRLVRGTWTVVVAAWPKGLDVSDALRTVCARDATGLCDAELARRAAPLDPPEGWDLHPRLPRSHVHHHCDEGLCTELERSVGIVRTPVDVPVTETLHVRWSWRVDTLPSALPEDTLLTHDYVSVALEFDDGKDMTWQWSAALPVGFAYTCPLDHWRHREFHVVARSGSGDLGRWVDEDRPVLADHRVAIGGPIPRRVVRAWLIGVAIFQGGIGKATYRSLELVDGDDVTTVI
jgi:hypothetical protein